VLPIARAAPPNYALNLTARAVGRLEQLAGGGARRKLTLLRYADISRAALAGFVAVRIKRERRAARPGIGANEGGSSARPVAPAELGADMECRIGASLPPRCRRHNWALNLTGAAIVPLESLSAGGRARRLTPMR
jgi:hypothetical protein